MAARVQKLERPSRGDGARVVHETLRREILSLELKPGAAIDETQIAQRFGLSRSPVREALTRLSAENLIVTQANRSSTVAPLDLADFPRYVEALDVLQRINTRLAALRATPADIAEMEAAARRFEATVAAYDHLEMSEWNKAFHMSIARAGRNPYLIRQYEALLDQGRRMLHLHFDYLAQETREEMLTSEHRAMIAAIAARDADEADRLAHSHTRQFHERFVNFLRRNDAAGFRLDLPPAPE